MAIRKIKILGAILEVCQLNSTANLAHLVHIRGELAVLFSWCLVAPKRPPGLIFSIAMGAYYVFEIISIETYAPQFIENNKIFLGSVIYVLT